MIPEKTKGRLLEVDLVVDRLRVDSKARSRLADSLELAFREGEDKAMVLLEQGDAFEEIPLSQALPVKNVERHTPLLLQDTFLGIIRMELAKNVQVSGKSKFSRGFRYPIHL